MPRDELDVTPSALGFAARIAVALERGPDGASATVEGDVILDVPAARFGRSAPRGASNRLGIGRERRHTYAPFLGVPIAGLLPNLRFFVRVVAPAREIEPRVGPVAADVRRAELDGGVLDEILERVEIRDELRLLTKPRFTYFAANQISKMSSG
jgi:hypothetical protein